MELVDDFKRFLDEDVNLNSARITKLESHVASIKNFLTDSDWGPAIKHYSAQGSWAHKTIIKPPGSGGFDADLLVFIDPVQDWTADDYIAHLRRTFRASGTYRDKTTLNTRCVTIEYAGDFEIDVVPCLVDRPGGASKYEVCNRVDDEFEATDSEAYTAWLEDRNDWVGGDKFREVTRLLKYLRDIKLTFSCKSILLTTLIGQQITAMDQLVQNAYFPDLPTALKTLVGRLDDYLQDNADLHDVCNPVLPAESFTRHWDDDKYANFRSVIHRYREWIDDAYGEVDGKESRSKWQRVFGDEFGKGAAKKLVTLEEAIVLPAAVCANQDAVQLLQATGTRALASVPETFPWVKPAPWVPGGNQSVQIRATAHKDRTGPQSLGAFQSGQLLRKGLQLRFEAVTQAGVPYTGRDAAVQWQVVNTDRDAFEDDGLRGGFYGSDPRGVRWETSSYRGIHWVQAFVIRKRDRKCIGCSARFFVVIE